MIVAMFTKKIGKQIPHIDNTAMIKHNNSNISTTQSIQFFGRSYLKNNIFSTCIKYDPTANESQRGTHTWKIAITKDEPPVKFSSKFNVFLRTGTA